jgi:hypothetical protein
MLTAFASNTKGADVESFIDAPARCSDLHIGQRPGGSVQATSTLARRSDPVGSFVPRTATSPARAPVLANCLTARGQNDPISGKTRPTSMTLCLLTAAGDVARVVVELAAAHRM